MQFENEVRGSDSLHSASHEAFGALGGCVLDGDREQRNRERRIRGWSLGLSVALQTVLITVTVMAPLLAKTETISYRVTPFPPYAGPPKSPRHPAPQHTSPQRPSAAIRWFAGIRPTMPQNPRPEDNFPGDPLFGPSSPVRDGVIPIDDSRLTPPPPEHERNPVTRVRIGHIEPAKLIKRVEPVYPALAIQIHRAGRVELHAIIGADGSIQSLEAIEGDALFVRSALAAVRQWRYGPTMLNGAPVEVDTHITVIYSML